jgi:hypothetical protein
MRGAGGAMLHGRSAKVTPELRVLRGPRMSRHLGEFRSSQPFRLPEVSPKIPIVQRFQGIYSKRAELLEFEPFTTARFYSIIYSPGKCGLDPKAAA